MTIITTLIKGGVGMNERRLNLADAKKHFSDVIGGVVHGGKPVLIMKRGRPVARIVPLNPGGSRLSDAKGWLDPGDDFFDSIEKIINERDRHVSRVMGIARR
jgi:prevent-host-death family protein